MLIEGFRNTYRNRGLSTDDLTVVTSVYNRFGAFKSMFRLLNHGHSENPPEVVVTSSMIIHEGAREAVRLQWHEGSNHPEVINLDEENWLNADDRKNAGPVYRPAKFLVKTASDLLFENIKA